MGTRFGIEAVVEKALAGRWIAGPYIEDAIRRAKALNERKVSAIINYLGEHLTEEKDVEDAIATYLQLIKEIGKAKVDASITLKVSQIGLWLKHVSAMRNYDRIVAFARQHGVFVWLDMESQDLVDYTIATYERQVRRKGVGIAIQAYLRRSEKDVGRLLKKRAVIRLVKGAYRTNSKIAFQGREEISANYLALMRHLFKDGKEFTVATHDSRLIDEAMTLNRSYRRKVMYAMLNGIRNNYAADLAQAGNRVAVYVPFGTRWIDYARRRLREWEHVKLVARSLLGG